MNVAIIAATIDFTATEKSLNNLYLFYVAMLLKLPRNS